jgi:hypothetical protein
MAEVLITTPAQVEQRLRTLSHEIDEAHNDLVASEHNYYSVKSEYEIKVAETRIKLSNESKPNGKNYTVDEREALAVVINKDLHKAMGIAEAIVRASRANSARLRVQVDLARSVGSNVRSSMEAL